MSITARSRRKAYAPGPNGALNRHRTSGSDRTVHTVSHVVLIVWAVIVLLPMLWTVFSSFKTSQAILTSPWSLPETWNFDAYVRAWTEARIGDFMVNTLIVVGGALFLVMLLGSMSAYVLARFEFPGNRLLYFGIVAGLTFPIFLAVIPLFFVLQNMGLQGTFLGLILAYVAYAYPFTVFFLYSFFRQLPDEIGEAAQIDGAGDFRTFFQIMLPMSAPGMTSVAIFNFLGLWNQYLLPIVLNTDSDKYVLTQGLVNLQAQQGYAADWSAMFAAVVITILPVLVVYLLFQRQLQGGVGPGTNK